MDERGASTKEQCTTEGIKRGRKQASFGRSWKNVKAKARSRVEYHYFTRYACLLLLPILLAVGVMTHMLITDYEEQTRQRVLTALDNVLDNLDAEITHLSNTTMQTAANPVFKNSYAKELPDAFESIRDTLENIMSSNRLFTQGSVAFYSASTPSIFYTEMGTFNEDYFRFYELDNNSTVSIRTVLENTQYMRILPYHALHTYYATVPALDVVYALTGQPGSFMIYSIPEAKMHELLVQQAYHPQEVYLLNANGNRLYPINLEKTAALDTMRAMIHEDMVNETVALADGRELLLVRSPLSGMYLAYVLSEDELFGNVEELSMLLYSAIAFIGLLGALLILVLSFWNARPIREILYLTERLSPVDEEVMDEAALDRIQSILIRLYQDQTARPEQPPLAEQAEAVMAQSPDADLLMDMEEEPAAQDSPQRGAEYDLVRQIMAFVDQHEEDGTLTVSLLAQVFQLEISNLSHQFKNRTGYALSDYLNARKLDVACAKLRDTRLPVAVIAEKLGYTHASSFIRMFKKVYGITPTQFRAEAQAVVSPHPGSEE